MPTLDLPTGRLAQCWDAALATLKEDPTLLAAGAVIVTYRDGYEESEKANPEPDDSRGPYLRLTFDPSNLRWENEHEHHCQANLGIALFTPGPDERDMLNLLEAVVHAFFPQDPTARAAQIARVRAIPGFITYQARQTTGEMATIGRSAHGLTCKFRMTFYLNILS